MTILINAANLRHGGGVQVAASFLDELAAILKDQRLPFSWMTESTFWASPEVLANLAAGTREMLDVEERSATLDVEGWRRDRFDASFTIFGPEYIPYRSAYNVVGFADITSLFPEHRIPARGAARVKQALRLGASRSSFRLADHIVVEAGHIARTLTQRWGIAPERITEVPNTYNALFRDPSMWLAPPERERTGDVAELLYVTRAYAHKNLNRLGAIAEQAAKLGTRVRFVLTLREDEWRALPPLTRAHAINVGPVTVAQLPRLYASCDAAIFPSLFEAFSVTPLEALITGTPLVASDRDFVRDVIGTRARYAEPTDPRAFAEAIVQTLRAGRDQATADARSFAEGWPDARSRALAYLATLNAGLEAT